MQAFLRFRYNGFQLLIDAQLADERQSDKTEKDGSQRGDGPENGRVPVPDPQDEIHGRSHRYDQRVAFDRANRAHSLAGDCDAVVANQRAAGDRALGKQRGVTVVPDPGRDSQGVAGQQRAVAAQQPHRAVRPEFLQALRPEKIGRIDDRGDDAEKASVRVAQAAAHGQVPLAVQLADKRQ